MATLTAEHLRLLLRYDPATGMFTRRVRRARRWAAGQVAGMLHPDGYIYIRIEGKSYRAHRLAWLYMTGDWPSDQIDHINRTRGDNRWGNLREATQAQNKINANAPANNTSGHTGVAWNAKRGRWHSYISVGGKKITLGRFKCLDEAIASRRNAAIRHYGEFAAWQH